MKKKRLLVIVDVVNGFIEFGALADPGIKKIVSKVVYLSEYFIKNNDPILAFLDTHEEDDIEFNYFPVHCLKGTPEAELVDELKVYEKHYTLIEKNTTNGFWTPELQTKLKNNYEEIVIVGCCSDICVLQFALTLQTYLGSQKSKTIITVIEDAVDTFNSKDHNRDQYHNYALDLMRNAGINVELSRDYFDEE